MIITKPIYTQLGEANPISWRQFVELITIEKNSAIRLGSDGGIEFNTHLGYSGESAMIEEAEAPPNGIEIDSFYNKVTIKLGPKDQMLRDLMAQSKKAMMCFTSIPRICEEMHLQYLEQYGESSNYMVYISKRQWMVGNPSDFRIFHHNGKYALACYQQNRTVIVNIKKVSEINDFTNKINKIAGRLNE